MKRSFKKLVSVAFIAIVACILFSLSAFAGGVDDKINSLRSKYPDGYFWNHKVTAYSNNGDQLKANWDESFSQSVTKSPCKTHSAAAAVGQYDCNFFDGGVQCFGFARRVFYDIFGVRASKMGQRYDINNVKVGDCIRIRNDSHSAVVIARNGNTLTLVEANLDLAGPSYNCKIRWGATCNVSEITYFHRASNYDTINNTNWKDSATKLDLGDNFYGTISNNARNKVIAVETNNNNNVAMYSYTGAANQIWHFKKNSDGTYTIKNCANGLVLDVNGGVSGWANIQTYSGNSSAAQKWRFYGTTAEMFISAECNKGVLDVADAKYDEGTNLTINTKSGNNAQIFSVKKLDSVGTPTLNVGSGNNVKFSWSAVKAATSYTLNIYKNSNASGSAYITKNLTGTSIDVKLDAGSYSAVLYAKNSYASSKSAVKTFTVNGASSGDDWTYANSLPSGVTSSNYTIQYRHTYTKTAKTSPGDGWVKGAVAKTEYVNKGNTYTSGYPLATSNTRVLVDYYYYHFCSGSKGSEVNYAQTNVFTHYDGISKNGLTECYQHADYADSRYTFYQLKDQNGNLVKCRSGYSCDGSYGSHGERSSYWYKMYVYQDKEAVNYYKYTKQGDWTNSKDSSASSFTVRYKKKPACTNHSYTSTVAKATLSKDGKITKKCKNCSATTTSTVYKIKSVKLSTTTYAYNGKVKTPSVTVKDSKGKTLKKDTDYTVKYSKGRKSLGKYTVTVTFKGNYSGSKKLTFEIVLAKGTLSKLSAGSKQLTATWKTVSGATGYEVAYSTSKKFTSKTTKKVKVNDAKTVKKTIKKLSKGKTYYVKVRAYKTVNKKPVYGAYSSVKSIKVK